MSSSSVTTNLSTALRTRLRQLSPKWVIGLSLLGLLLVGLPILKARSSAQTAETTAEANAENNLPVETITASEVSSYEVSRAYTGEIAALQASELGFERSGQLTALLVPEGTQVNAGQALAQLDIQNLQTQRLQIEAERAQAIAQFTELETGARAEDIAAASAAVQDLEQQVALEEVRLTRREVLYEKGAISQEALDEVSFGEGALQARLDQARSQLEELQNGTRPEQLSAQDAVIQRLDARLADVDVNIAKSTLTAPFTGTVAAHQVDPGTVVSPGQSVIRLVENDIPEARIGLPADTTSQLNIGTDRTVTVNAEQYTGTLTAILPEVDAQTRTQTAIFALEPRAASQVSPGQTVRLNLSDRIDTTGIWLPAEAITQGIRGLWTCYVVVPQETTEDDETTTYVVQPQTVEIVHQTGDRVLVTGTLQPGDRIVASGSHRLVPGQQVIPQPQ
ncbi:MAG: efflux RND transporter periplasmic adaptor subunit [Cyanobacteria bacterium J06588_5]